MPTDTAMPSQECNCLALRQAARHVTQFYDQCLAPAGLRTTQLSILTKLKRLGPLTINALARELVMDRTTLGRTMLPLERDGLIAIKDGTLDRRSKELHLTKAGAERHRVAGRLWSEAQTQFEATFGGERASALRNELRAVASSELEIVPEAGKDHATADARARTYAAAVRRPLGHAASAAGHSRLGVRLLGQESLRVRKCAGRRARRRTQQSLE